MIFCPIIISLRSNAERRAHAIKSAIQLAYDEQAPSRCFFPIQVIDAVEMDDLPAHEIGGNRQQYVRANPGLRACTLSHLKALRVFLESGEQRTIVFEDDFVADKALLREVIDNLPKQWDLLQFHHSFLNWGHPKHVRMENMHWWRVSPCGLRSLSYAVTRPMAEEILKRSKTITDHFDHLLRRMSREPEFRFFMSRDEIVREAGFPSTLQHA